jgi:hypothetical protein
VSQERKEQGVIELEYICHVINNELMDLKMRISSNKNFKKHPKFQLGNACERVQQHHNHNDVVLVKTKKKRI